MIDEIIGEYRILQEVGSGGWAIAYRGEHVTRKTIVCLKRLIRPHDEAYIAPFRREAVMLWGIQHESLPALEACYDDPARGLTIVMPFFEGEDLMRALKKRPISGRDACWITIRVLDALSYLHGRGLVHRDVKPGNIMFDPVTRRAILIDFGLCTNDPASDLQPGYLCGTPGHMAPELLYGMAATPASDLYALGATLAQMAGMEFDKDATMPPEMRALRPLLPPLKPTRSVHPALRHAIDVLMARDPADRPASADAARVMLHYVSTILPETA